MSDEQTEARNPDPNRGCRRMAISLGVVALLFCLCVGVGVGLFMLDLRQKGGDAVREDLLSLVEQAELPEQEAAALRTRIEALVGAYQEGKLEQDPFLEEAIALRERLLEQVPPEIPPETPPEAFPEEPTSGRR